MFQILERQVALSNRVNTFPLDLCVNVKYYYYMTRLRKRTATGKRRLHRRRWRSPEAGKPTHEELLEAAADEAKLNGKSLTAIREHVLDVLLNAGRPLSAYEVLDSLDGVGSVSPPTAYRALDFLIHLGFVKRIESLNTYMALPQGPSDVPVALFVCETCGQAEEIASPDAVGSLMQTVEAQGFGAQTVSLEVRGDCRGRLGCDASEHTPAPITVPATPA